VTVFYLDPQQAPDIIDYPDDGEITVDPIETVDPTVLVLDTEQDPEPELF